MANSALHRRTTSSRPVHRIRRRVHSGCLYVRRSKAARHLPFTAYILITVVGMGWTLVLVTRAAG